MTSPTSLPLLDYCEYEMALAHTPVLLDELVELLRPAEGEVGLRRHLRSRRARRRGGGGARAERSADRLRPRPDGRGFLPRRRVRRPLSDEARPRQLRRRAGAAAGRVTRHHLHGPRRLVHAARPPGARLLLRVRRAPRHADGPGRRRSAADLVNELPEEELQAIFRRYGEERYAREIARGIVEASGTTAARRPPASWSRSSSARSRRRRGSAPATPPGGCSRRCGS